MTKDVEGVSEAQLRLICVLQNEGSDFLSGGHLRRERCVPKRSTLPDFAEANEKHRPSGQSGKQQIHNRT